MDELPSFSIVINTLNRGDLLQKTLDSLQWLDYRGEFEVVVVNGPSTDNSDEVIQAWSPRIRAGRCPVANLSVSRNIGICMAQGEVVAFIDDDAIPEPEWLQQLAVPYADPKVGGAGGLVYDHTGYSFQYRYGVVDRFGNADLTPDGPSPHLAFPKSGRVPHLLGANSSFRRSALLEVGGFDEEFEYYLDETDVCLRIVDAGYIIAQLPCAYVHHKFAPSNLRSTNRVPRFRYPIIKNKAYFTLKHAREFHSLERILQEQRTFIDEQRAQVTWCHANRMLDQDDVDRFEADVERGLRTGLQRGFEGVCPGAYIDSSKLEAWQGSFLPFVTHAVQERKCVVMVRATYEPDGSDSLPRMLGARGHTVHVITKSADIDRVDFENGVWVHRMLVEHAERSSDALFAGVPQDVWDWSHRALREAERIAMQQTIDVIEAPVWDGEGIAVLLDRRWPLLSGLGKTLHASIDECPQQRTDEVWMAQFGRPMLALERRLIADSDAVHSLGAVERLELERILGVALDADRIVSEPLRITEKAWGTVGN